MPSCASLPGNFQRAMALHNPGTNSQVYFRQASHIGLFHCCDGNPENFNFRKGLFWLSLSEGSPFWWRRHSRKGVSSGSRPPFSLVIQFCAQAFLLC